MLMRGLLLGKAWYSHHLLKHFPLLAPPLEPTPRPTICLLQTAPWSARPSLGLPPFLCEIAPPLPLEQVLQNKILFGSVILVSEKKEGSVFLGAGVGGYLLNL